jgi:hypothetical protein
VLVAAGRLAAIGRPVPVLRKQSPRHPCLQEFRHAGSVKGAGAPDENRIGHLLGTFWHTAANRVNLANGREFQRFEDPT